jgi:hypothetical protein
MGNYECHQAGYLPPNGLFPMSCQNLLRQIPTACGPGPDPRIDLGPQGMLCDLYTPLILVLTIF